MTTHTVDTFGGSSVDLGSHTPDSGGPWVNIDADTNHLKTSGSNSLNATTTTNGDGSYAVDVGSADMYAEMTLGSFTQIPTNGLGLAVRISDKNNFYGISRASTSACSVLKRVGGSFTVFNTNLSIPNRSASDLIRIEIVGNVLTIYNDGTSIYSVTDSGTQPPTSTKAGFYTHNTSAGTNILTKFEADAVGTSGVALLGQAIGRVLGAANINSSAPISGRSAAFVRGKPSVSAAASVFGYSRSIVRARAAAAFQTSLRSMSQSHSSGRSGFSLSAAIAALGSARASAASGIDRTAILSSISAARTAGAAVVTATMNLLASGNARTSALAILRGPGALIARAMSAARGSGGATLSASLQTVSRGKAQSTSALGASVGLGALASSFSQAAASASFQTLLGVLAQALGFGRGNLSTGVPAPFPLDDAAFVDATAAKTYTDATQRTIYVSAKNRWRP